jgi:hypothetical protein
MKSPRRGQGGFRLIMSLVKKFVVMEQNRSSRFELSRQPIVARHAHNRSADQHENAAKAHCAAAEPNGKGDHGKSKEHPQRIAQCRLPIKADFSAAEDRA